MTIQPISKVKKLMNDSGSPMFLLLNLKSHLLSAASRRFGVNSKLQDGNHQVKSWNGYARLPDGNKIMYHWKDRHEISYVVKEIYQLGVYDHAGAPRTGETVVDVGGHIGIYTTYAATKVGPAGQVVAVEPSPDNFSFLCHNIAANGFKNVTPVNIALADAPGTAKLFLDGSGRHSLLSKGGNDYIDTKLMPLDSLVEQLKLENIDLLKIDVEGFELKVLMGGAEALKSKIKRLAIAAYHYPTEVEEVTSFIKSVAPHFKFSVFPSRKESPEDVFLFAYS